MTEPGTIISTERLFLREFNPVVSKKVFEGSTKSEMLQFLGLVLNEELLVEKERYDQGFTMFGRSFNYFHLILRDSGKVIGWCGFHTIYTRHNRGELGYVLNDDMYKGKGYMKEAIGPVLKFGFEELNLHRIEAFIAEENTPSLKLLTANKFVREGVLREHYFVNGKHEDSIVYSLLKKEFL